MAISMVAIKKARSLVILALENVFYRWGRFVARRPVVVIIASLLLSALSGLGILNLEFETDGNALWIPEESPFLADSNWLKENFDHDKPRRINSLIVEDVGQPKNVLTQEALQLMLKVHALINQINPQNVTFDNICYRIPIANILSEDEQKSCGREKRSTARKRSPKNSYSSNNLVNKEQRRFVRSTDFEYDNTGFDYNYDYGSDASKDNDEKQSGSGILGNLFNWKRNGYYKISEETVDTEEFLNTTTSPKNKPSPNKSSNDTIATPEDKSSPDKSSNESLENKTILSSLIEELGIDVKRNTSKTNASSLNLIQPTSKNVEPTNTSHSTLATTESTSDLTTVAKIISTTESNIPNEYDCGDFCGDYDYTFKSPEEEYRHKDFGGFGALFKQIGTFLSFASFDRCQKNIAYKIPLENYCDIVRNLEKKCFEQSLLEIWSYDATIIEKLTNEEIIEAVNKYDRSPYFGYAFNYSTILGGIKGNDSHKIVTANSVMYNFATTVDLNNIVSISKTQNAGTEFFPLDEENLVWQKEVIKELIKIQEELDRINGNGNLSQFKIRINMSRSFTDIASSAIFVEVFKVIMGYILMFVYTSLMLGKFNVVHQRFYLTFMGIFSVILGILVSVGWTGIFGLPYTPVHAILPFLMIGIGIDNMFVIVQCWYNLEKRELNSIEEEIGLTMKHAGVTITVTSLTDICAFAVGCITILPGLSSFCITCAFGIAATYLLQITWFTAWLSIDTLRIESKRNSFLPCCWKHPSDWKPSEFIKFDLSKAVLNRSCALLHSRLYRIFIITMTASIFGAGMYGAITIRQEFDEVNMLPADSYLRQWFDSHNILYPSVGSDAKVYTGALNPETDLEKMDILIDELSGLVEEGKYLTSVDSWWTEFKIFLLEKYQITNWKKSVILIDDKDAGYRDTKTFHFLLSDFLFTPIGAKYKEHFVLNGTLVCNEPSPAVLATSTSMVYQRFEGRSEYTPAKTFLRDIIDAKNFSSYAFSFSHKYRTWETVEIIGFELWRNLGLALACVFVITFVLLADTTICLMVFTCVAFTLVDVVGALNFWGTTLDPLSSVNIILAVGLCIDYPAHIAHSFLVATGSSVERAKASLHDICPAVLNGGMTTFLALVVLADSNSHAFLTFFKVFFLTVVFGMFHGVVFLPALMSWIGGDNKKDDVSQIANTNTEAISKHNKISLLDKIFVYITGVKSNPNV